MIQYIYQKYGRERTALAATVICYRGRSALRDVAKALGLGNDQVDELTRCITYHDSADALDERLREKRGSIPRRR